MTAQTETQKHIVAIIADVRGIDPARITPGAMLREDLGADSLDCVEIAMSIEEELGVAVSDDAIETARQVADLFALGEKAS